MKIAFGMFVKNEERFLRCALSCVQAFDDSFAIDYGSTDGTLDILKESKIKRIYREEWKNDHGLARMRMVEIARDRGADWLFTLDGDEALMVDYNRLQSWTSGSWTSVSFPRLNATANGFYKRSWWPDIQHRGLKLDQDIEFAGGPIHAVPLIGKVVVSSRDDNLLVQSASIMHYGLMKPAEFVDLKSINYRRLIRGDEPLDKLPEGHIIGSEFNVLDGQPIL